MRFPRAKVVIALYKKINFLVTFYIHQTFQRLSVLSYAQQKLNWLTMCIPTNAPLNSKKEFLKNIKGRQGNKVNWNVHLVRMKTWKGALNIVIASRSILDTKNSIDTAMLVCNIILFWTLIQLYIDVEYLNCISQFLYIS